MEYFGPVQFFVISDICPSLFFDWLCETNSYMAYWVIGFKAKLYRKNVILFGWKGYKQGENAFFI